MAQRRMFSPQIIDSDAFLDMPVSAQSLYFHLGMRADDDGFVGNPKKIMRMAGGNEDDLKLLIAKRFILIFENGVIVIKHWRINNLIRKDWYKETAYIEEKKRLKIKENGAYTELVNENATKPPRRLGKVSLGKVILDNKETMKNKKYFVNQYRERLGKEPIETTLTENQLDFIIRDNLIPIFKKAVNEVHDKTYFAEDDDVTDYTKENSRLNAQIKLFWNKCKKDMDLATEVIIWFAGDYGKFCNWKPSVCFRKETVVDYRNRETKKGKTLRELTQNK